MTPVWHRLWSAERQRDIFKSFSFLGKALPVSSEKENYDIEGPGGGALWRRI